MSSEKSQAEVFQDDIHALLEVLGLGNHARPESPHQVLHQEVIPAIKRLKREENGSSPSSPVAQSCAARNTGRFDALKEKFERQADRCQEQERYEAMDVWRDAAADVEQVRESSEAPKAVGDEPESTHWEVKYQDWYGVWRDYSEDGLSKRERAKRVFQGYDDGAKLYRVEKHLVNES